MQKAILASLRTNAKREAAGGWEPSVLWPESNIRYHVRAISYEPYKTAHQRLQREHAKKYGAGRTVPEDVLAQEVGALLAEHILLGWEGIDVEYSPAAAMSTLTNPEFKLLSTDVEMAAAKFGNVNPDFVKGEATSKEPSASA